MKIITICLIICSCINAQTSKNLSDLKYQDGNSYYGIDNVDVKNNTISGINLNQDIKFEQLHGDSINGAFWPNAFYGSTNELSVSFADLDADGDLDLVQGSRYRLEWILNSGDAASFKWGDLDWGNIIQNQNKFWTPELVDIDNDNDFDLFCGTLQGTIIFFENVGSITQPIWSIPTDNYLNINVGARARPAFCDIDNDGDKDLFIGNKDYGQKKGFIYFYQNVGDSTNPLFELTDSSYVESYSSGGVSPEFCDIDGDGDFDLFIAAEWGNIVYYSNSGTRLEPIWTYAGGQYAGISMGWSYLQTRFADIDNDRDFDMLLTDLKGYFYLYENIGNDTLAEWKFSTLFFNNILNFGRSSGPGSGDIDGDGDNDIVFGNNRILENVGSSLVPKWKINDRPYTNQEYLFDMTTLTDIDGDGDLDLFYGDNNGYIKYYENLGTPSSPYWSLVTTQFENIYYGSNTHVSVSFADIDGDGDNDMFVQHVNWNNNNYPTGFDLISFYKNVGTKFEPQWELVDENYLKLAEGGIGFGRCSFEDIDNDDDIDCLCGDSRPGKFYLYLNTGASDSADWSFYGELNNGIGVENGSSYATPILVDLNNDYFPEIVSGLDGGGINFWWNKTDHLLDATFSPLADMTSKRAGMGYTCDGKNIYTISGGTNQFPYVSSSIESYDIQNNNWTEVRNDLAKRWWVSSEYISSQNKIYIFNGYFVHPLTDSTFAYAYTDTMEIFDVTTGNLSYDTSNPFPVQYAGSAVWNDRIYVFGGSNSNGFSNRLYEFNPVTFEWVRLTDMPEAKQTSGRVVDGLLYVFGGYMGTVSNRIDCYDIQNKNWTFVGNMPDGISAHATATSGNYIWLVGNYADLRSLAFFNTETNIFSTLISNMTGRRHAGAIIVDNYLYTFGGNQTSSFESSLDNMEHTDISNFVVSIEKSLANKKTDFYLNQNYPNPFNPKTIIQFNIPKADKVSLKIYNMLGQKVVTLLDESMISGYHEVEFNAQYLTSGIYYYKLKSGNFEDVKKMILLK